LTSFVGRGGFKLQHALKAFSIKPHGFVCADLGCNVGGFTDCLLQSGATKVYAIDTGYGALAWTLRNDPRVVVMERTNALHTTPPEPVDLVVIDLGWTPQRHAIGPALRCLKADGQIISLIKPHYEVPKAQAKSLLKAGVLAADDAERIVTSVCAEFPDLGAGVRGLTRSPIEGGASKGNKRGNAEWLVLLQPVSRP
jgi:23S rRNA (cytidine1920-2'-O)/16S rRNA (cytidine1409-2'-O)-methyltransferase